jgi:hypothetical protein
VQARPAPLMVVYHKGGCPSIQERTASHGSILSSCGAQRSSVPKPVLSPVEGGAARSLPPTLALAPPSSIHRPARFDTAFGLLSMPDSLAFASVPVPAQESILSSCGAQRSSVPKPVLSPVEGGAARSLPPTLALAPPSSIHRPARFDTAFGLSFDPAQDAAQHAEIACFGHCHIARRGKHPE